MNLPPYNVFFDITKSDTVAQPAMDALYVGGAGDLVVAGGDGVARTFKAPPVGTVLQIAPKLVMAATTATLLVGMRQL